MKIEFVDLKKQYEQIKTEIDQAIAEVINETAFIGGDRIKKFEDAFAAYTGTKHCIACGNGTDSIEILLKAMNIGAGDEVIVPAHSWISTSEAVSAVGAKPIFIDTLPDKFTIDPAKIEKAINKKTKAIIPVHIYGLPAEMDEIMAIAAKHDLKVLEDCAQAHGALYKGKMIGTFGNAASFSFYPGKNLGAYGDAGGMITNNDGIAKTARAISNHGQLQKHDHIMEGRNSRMDGIQAAVLLVKLPHLDKWNENRRKIAALYDKYITSTHIKKPIVPEYTEPVFHLYVVKVKRREDLIDYLQKKGVSTGIHYPTMLPFLKPYINGIDVNKFTNSKEYENEILSLPIFPEMTEEEVKYVAESINGFYT